jgi:hypothetical protein
VNVAERVVKRDRQHGQGLHEDHQRYSAESSTNGSASPVADPAQGDNQQTADERGITKHEVPFMETRSIERPPVMIGRLQKTAPLNRNAIGLENASVSAKKRIMIAIPRTEAAAVFMGPAVPAIFHWPNVTSFSGRSHRRPPEITSRHCRKHDLWP